MDAYEWVKSFVTSSYGSVAEAEILPRKESLSVRPLSPPPSRGSFATFVCHVSSLEAKLRSFSPIVLDDKSIVKETGRNLGEGTTFMVRHAQWVKDPNEPPLDVALKEIIADVRTSHETASSSIHRPKSDWKDILFELRALLHEPIRYHPNLVRLLGIQWGLSAISESAYPLLIMEYALGALGVLQASSEPLSFRTKQKLCYDIGRGLSALHACGIVHGDLKHENVLVFLSKKPVDGITYTAKLADFGGTVMDMKPSETREMTTWTWPFQAPEVTNRTALTRDGMMRTDTYSFGLLLWRAFLDGTGFVSLAGASSEASAQEKANLNQQKASEAFTNTAVADIISYAAERCMPQPSIDLFVYAILHTVRYQPDDRDLDKAQAVLRGIPPGHVSSYLGFIKEKNDEREASEAREAPGRHGITRDALSFFLGRHGDDVDLQDNMPGNRPNLDPPNAEDFAFDAEALKRVLTWNQQVQMLDELKSAANADNKSSDGVPEIKKTVAAFYVFQCYLLEFGTIFDAAEASKWLQRAAADVGSHEDEDYLSQAWMWRISAAFDVHVGLDTGELIDLLGLSVIRGHRGCLQDLLNLSARCGDVSLKSKALQTHQQYSNILLSQMGAIGMGYFFPRFMTPPWDTVDLNSNASLEKTIRTILGSRYDTCLKSNVALAMQPDSQTSRDREANAFDRIYVNGRGHGPLHYAAATGALSALQYLVTTYDCNLNIANQHVDETPLLSAAEGGKFECAVFILENGGDPNGYRYSQEGPLHWLSSFAPTHMELMASKLIDAGADIELRSGGMRHDVRGVRADWEHMLEIKTTPLGRAVLMNNLDAVNVLLKLGANPLARSANKHPKDWEGSGKAAEMVDVSSPFELAAVLTLDDILAAFISHIDGLNGPPKLKLINEISMLDLAHEKKITKFDPLSLQSRLVRCGTNYKRDLQVTLALLYARGACFNSTSSDDARKEQSRVLCREIAMGNADIVECLLSLGYNVDGTQNFRPLETAIQMNNVAMFNLLRRYNANMRITRMTPTGSISLLHVCASRSKQTRPGRNIADQLIAAGIPVESEDERSRSPLATAIVSHNFDVATALIENGANVDATYHIQVQGYQGLETRRVSVLVEILSQHTMRTLESLKFLFNLDRKPEFHVEPSAKFSILHLLASSPQYTNIAQITPRILNMCLDTYSNPDQINYKHPIAGAPLYHAASNAHWAMVEMLLQRHADVSYHAGPDLDGSVQTVLRPRESYTPLWAAITRLDEEIKRNILLPPSGPPGTWLRSNVVQNLQKTVEMLAVMGDPDEAAQRAIAALQQRMSSVSDEANAWRMDQIKKRREKRADSDEMPVDLGVLLGGASEGDEKRIREICQGPKVEWRTEALAQFLETLKL